MKKTSKEKVRFLHNCASPEAAPLERHQQPRPTTDGSLRRPPHPRLHTQPAEKLALETRGFLTWQLSAASVGETLRFRSLTRQWWRSALGRSHGTRHDAAVRRECEMGDGSHPAGARTLTSHQDPLIKAFLVSLTHVQQLSYAKKPDISLQTHKIA